MNDDFKNYYFSSEKSWLITKGTIQHYLSQRFDISLNAIAGDVGTHNNKINQHVTSTIRSGDLTMHLKFFSDENYLRPYAFLGMGLLYADNYLARENYMITFPLGTGMRFSPKGERLQFDLNVRLDNTLTDKLDGYVAGDYYDNFLTYSVGIIVLLGKNKDEDGDGVSDKKDKCPGTVIGAKVDEKGCQFDADKDGVMDEADRCANTLPSVQVDALGCPLDTDKDGVADYLDKCTGTPLATRVDVNGCPLDGDGDGVSDDLDKCPNTSANIKVDASGCPLDADGDAVADYLDKCPETPANVKVDTDGCPLDGDKDGVADYLDRCPAVAGTIANGGCPEPKKEDIIRLQKIAKYINFETGKDVLKISSHTTLDEVAKLMKDNPTYHLSIEGHTDNVGKEDYNMELSVLRSAAVRAYLLSKNVEQDRVVSTGFGMSVPIDSNKTSNGRANNRRVELKLK